MTVERGAKMKVGRGLVACCVVSMASFLTSCATPASEPRVEYTDLPPGTPGSADSAEAAVGGADVVIVGEILNSQPGRVVGPEGEPGVAFLETEVAVTEVLSQAKGSEVTVGDIVLVETELLPGDASEIEGGEKVVSALWLKRDQESAGRYYRPIHRDAWLLLGASGELTSLSSDETVVAQQFEALALDGVRELVLTQASSG